MFALPEREGFISIGVFDGSGRLVRRLAECASEQDFPAGLNGLIVEWDGADDHGAPVAGGTYRVKGYVTPPLELEGLRYRFNDWIEAAGPAMELVGIGPVAAIDGDTLAAVAVRPNGTLFVFAWRAGEGLLWHHDLEGGAAEGALEVIAPVFSATSGHVLAGRSRERASELLLLSSVSGGEVGVIALENPPTAACLASENNVVVAVGGSLQVFDPATGQVRALADTPFQGRVISLDASVAGILTVAEDGGGVWNLQEGDWSEITIEGGLALSGASWAGADRFWGLIVSGSGEPSDLGLFSLDGELLRRVAFEELGTPLAVGGTADGKAVFVNCRGANPPGSRVIGMRAMEVDGSEGWGIFLNQFAREISPDAAEVFGEAGDGIEVRTKDPLSGGSARLSLRAALAEEKFYLATADALRLAPLLSAAGFSAATLQRAETGATELRLAGSAFVEEFHVSGLAEIVVLDVGTVEWDGSGFSDPEAAP